MLVAIRSRYILTNDSFKNVLLSSTFTKVLHVHLQGFDCQ